MHRYQILMEYVGTNFYGWQYQKKQITIQGTVEKNFKKILKEKVKLYGSGRTDAQRSTLLNNQLTLMLKIKLIILKKFQSTLNFFLNKKFITVI